MNTSLKLLSDVDTLKDTEIYKLLSSDIFIIKSFFTIDEDQNLNQSKQINDFKNYLKDYIENKDPEDYNSILQLLNYFSIKRPKLIPIICSIFPIILEVYQNQKEEIIYCINHEYCKSNNSLLFNNLIQKCDFNDFSCFESISLFYSEEDENIFSILYYDNIEALISFLSNNPTFDIKQNLEISKNTKYFSLLKLFNLEEENISLIRICCLFGSVNCFKYLIMNNCSIDKTSKDSIKGGNNEIIQILNQKSVNFNNCFTVSVEFHRYSISDWLLLNFNCESVSLPNCISFYNFEAFLFFLYNGHPIDEIDENQRTAFYYCCANGFESLCQFMLSNGVNIESQDKDLNKPLHVACENNHFSIVKQLFIHKCEKEPKTKYKFTPLHYASQHCCLKIVAYLLSNGCDKECKNISEETPLHLACEKGHLSIVKYLIENGCNKESKNIYGRTPLHYACENGFLFIVQYLISQGCNKEPIDQHGETPLHYACKKGSLDVVEYLWSQGCNLEPLDKIQRTPLHIACVFGHLPIVEFLLSHGCNKESLDQHDYTPLHYACVCGKLNVVEFLISEGCNKDPKDKSGHTPIYYAYIKNYKKLVEFMLSKGCNEALNFSFLYF